MHSYEAMKRSAESIKDPMKRKRVLLCLRVLKKHRDQQYKGTLSSFGQIPFHTRANNREKAIATTT